MFTKTEQKFTFIFALIVLLELICGHFEPLQEWHNFTKPLIVLSLIIFFLSESRFLNTQIRILITLALVLSLLGDIALLFDQIDPIFFIVGLASFLLAHVMYIIVFLKQRDKGKQAWRFILLMLLYAIILFYRLQAGLGDLLIPVLVYMVVILIMSTTAFLRKKADHNLNFKWVFTGAILFMASDSILAIDKFYYAFDLSSIVIMLTYALAQYCIVIGILKSHDNTR